VREREDANRTREAGHLDEIQGGVANTLNSFRNGAVDFIDWLGLFEGSFRNTDFENVSDWIVCERGRGGEVIRRVME
jgi:hypothetical protein